ncbi:MAG: hypothetical protein LPK92_00040 [Actinomycetes bacterium]|nr:hypothetical protein [Actinomycetes bacterium]
MCATAVPVQERDCPGCHTGLAEYAAVWYLPDQLFNEGVVHLRRGDAAAAATLFAQVCWFRPDDVAARRAWAHACSVLGRHEEAALLLGEVMERAPGPDVEEQYAEALAALDAGGEAGTGTGEVGTGTGGAAPQPAGAAIAEPAGAAARPEPRGQRAQPVHIRKKSRRHRH